MNEKSAASTEELQLLYQVTVNDLAYFKTQQWSVTNYAFLLQAGIVGAWQLTKADSTFTERCALAVLALAVAAASLTVLKKLQDSIIVRQSRLNAAREHFSLAFHEAWASETKPGELIHSVTFLRSAVFIGTLAVCWLLFRA